MNTLCNWIAFVNTHKNFVRIELGTHCLSHSPQHVTLLVWEFFWLLFSYIKALLTKQQSAGVLSQMVATETSSLRVLSEDGGNILNPPSLHPWAGKPPELNSPWSRSPGPVSSYGPEFDVGLHARSLHLWATSQAANLAVYGGLISVSLHLNPASYTADGFLPERSGCHGQKCRWRMQRWHTPNTFSLLQPLEWPRPMACFSFPCKVLLAHLQSYHWKELSLKF